MKVEPPARWPAARLGTEGPTSQADVTRLAVQKPCLQMMCCLLRAAGEENLYQESEDSAKMTGSRMAFASRG